MEYPPKKAVKQLLQFVKRGDLREPILIGTIYEDTSGRQSGVIELNIAVESPKGDERYLSFIVVDSLTANKIRNKYYCKKDVKAYRKQA